MTSSSRPADRRHRTRCHDARGRHRPRDVGSHPRRPRRRPHDGLRLGGQVRAARDLRRPDRGPRPSRCSPRSRPGASTRRASTPSSPRVRRGPTPANPRSTPSGSAWSSAPASAASGPCSTSGTSSREKGPRRVYPLAVPMLMPNGPSAAVSLDLGARAGAHTPVSACASGAESMGYAIDMIRTGRADVVVAGGTEAAVHALPIAGFAAMQALSTRNDEPTKASRPYDTGRDGFVLGEGAAVIVLESEEHAKARGAQIYAELAGVGMSADAHHITAPEPNGSGASRAMARPSSRPASRSATSLTSTRTRRRPRSATWPSPTRSSGPSVGPDRRHRGHGDEVDDRPPARRRGRARGGLHDPLRPPPPGAGDDQPRRPGPRDPAQRRRGRAPHARPTATSRR